MVKYFNMKQTFLLILTFFMFSCSEQDGALFNAKKQTVEIGQVWTVSNDDPFFPMNDTFEIIDIKKDYALIEWEYENRKIRRSEKTDFILDYCTLLKQ